MIWRFKSPFQGTALFFPKHCGNVSPDQVPIRQKHICTTAGDMTAATMRLGYFLSGVLFAALIAVPALAYWIFGLNEVLAFWLAYILTRPLGASFADWIWKPKSLSGVGVGTGQVSLFLTILIVILVWYLAVTRKDIKVEQQSVSVNSDIK
jgi:uncharacterized membrane-anchored protein